MGTTQREHIATDDNKTELIWTDLYPGLVRNSQLLQKERREELLLLGAVCGYCTTPCLLITCWGEATINTV